MGHFTRFCVESYYRFTVLSVHRSLWVNEAGHFHAGIGIGLKPRTSARRVVDQLCATVPPRSSGSYIYGDIQMTDVVMPQMGESIVEGTLTKWLKKAGEHVDRDEPLFEISTDKVDTEIPSPAAGVLKEVLVEEGKTVAISTVVGRIEEGAGNGASAPAPAAAKAPPEQKAAPAAAPKPAPAPPAAPAPVAKAPAPPTPGPE